MRGWFSLRGDLSLRRLIDVLNKDQLVVFFVVHELVDYLRSQHYAEAARSQAELAAHIHMPSRLIGRIRKSRMLDFLDARADTLTPAHHAHFVRPRIATWDIDVKTKAMRIVLRSQEPRPGQKRALNF